MPPIRLGCSQTESVMNESQLAAAYEATNFWVDVSRECRFALRCGEANPTLDELLEKSGAVDWAYITACNPRSTLLTSRENEERMTRLRDCLHQGGYSFFPGEGVADNSTWPPEPSFLVMGITESDALSIARLFEQNAILIGSRGGPARLQWVCAEA